MGCTCRVLRTSRRSGSGVTPERFATLRTYGVYGCGVLGGLFLDPDPEGAAREYLTVAPASQLSLLR